MKYWLVLGLLSFRCLAVAADSVALGCERLELVLDSKLTPEVLRRAWASGEPRSDAPAVLEFRGCKGELLDRLTLEAPLAQLDTTPLRGAPAPTYLVTVDLTAAIGSYSGPLTRPVQRQGNHLKWVSAVSADGRLEPINLASTGKAAWRRFSTKPADDLLSVNCQPLKSGFVIVYRRFHPGKRGWLVLQRSQPGFWEADGEFPNRELFP